MFANTAYRNEEGFGWQHPPGVARIGSCFAVSIATEFNKLTGGSVAGMLAHFRSDALVQSSVNGLWAHPSTEALDQFASRHGNAEKLQVNIRRLRCQSQEAVAGFKNNLHKADIIFLDNHYDITAELYPGDDGVGENSMLKLIPAKHYKSRNLPFLSPDESIANILSLMRWLQSFAPDAVVVFAPVPKSAVQSHAKRHAAFAECLMEFDVSRLPPRCFILPKMDLPEALFDRAHGNFYFTPLVYRAYVQLTAELMGGQRDMASARKRLSYLLDQGDAIGGHQSAKQGEAELHPYAALPEKAYWRLGVSGCSPLEISGLYQKRFSIGATDRLATFGSCFAQHVGARLKSAKFNFVEYEKRPKSISDSEGRERGYGIYSARYGNIYTPRQLTQLFLRAFGEFRPAQDYWEENGRYFDPFRPTIEAGGFSSLQELIAAREEHFQSVRELFRDADVIFFTLGLTEAWTDTRDGAVYPVCPGTAHGNFDSSIHHFRNFDVIEICDDFGQLVECVKSINPGVRFVLTVSPVPLVATMSGQHVLVATMHSKSILRAACSLLYDKYRNVDYFPSYEIVASHPYRAMFYDSNLRTVTSNGVDHVMTQFFKEHLEHNSAGHLTANDADLEELCDEVLLDPGR